MKISDFLNCISDQIRAGANQSYLKIETVNVTIKLNKLGEVLSEFEVEKGSAEFSFCFLPNVQAHSLSPAPSDIADSVTPKEAR
jgi:hypothetical protein